MKKRMTYVTHYSRDGITSKSVCGAHSTSTAIRDKSLVTCPRCLENLKQQGRL